MLVWRKIHNESESAKKLLLMMMIFVRLLVGDNRNHDSAVPFVNLPNISFHRRRRMVVVAMSRNVDRTTTTAAVAVVALWQSNRWVGVVVEEAVPGYCAWPLGPIQQEDNFVINCCDTH